MKCDLMYFQATVGSIIFKATHSKAMMSNRDKMGITADNKPENFDVPSVCFCKKTEQRCKLNDISIKREWIQTSKTEVDGKPALLNDSILKCSEGGKLNFEDNGQNLKIKANKLLAAMNPDFRKNSVTLFLIYSTFSLPLGSVFKGIKAAGGLKAWYYSMYAKSGGSAIKTVVALSQTKEGLTIITAAGNIRMISQAQFGVDPLKTSLSCVVGEGLGSELTSGFDRMDTFIFTPYTLLKTVQNPIQKKYSEFYSNQKKLEKLNKNFSNYEKNLEKGIKNNTKIPYANYNIKKLEDETWYIKRQSLKFENLSQEVKDYGKERTRLEIQSRTISSLEKNLEYNIDYYSAKVNPFFIREGEVK